MLYSGVVVVLRLTNHLTNIRKEFSIQEDEIKTNRKSGQHSCQTRFLVVAARVRQSHNADESGLCEKTEIDVSSEQDLSVSGKKCFA